MSLEKNLYEILEVSSSSSFVTIKAAYRKLVRIYHPDLNLGDNSCVKKFKEITEAYEVLSNVDKKKKYDILRGFDKENSHTKRNEANKAYKNAYYSNPKQSTPKETNHKDLNQKSSNFHNIFNDILEGFKKTNSKKDKQVYPERGRDVYADVKITIGESLEGTTRIVNVLHTEQCTKCEGRVFANGAKCSLCGGEGEHSTQKKITVKIPAHIKDGSKIRIANEGNKGYNGGKNGDLYLNIKIKDMQNSTPTNLNFKYDGLNVLWTIQITPFEAALGALIDVKTPQGKVLMKVSKNTHSGQKFRLSNQGLKKNDKIGDMIVTVNIEIPQNISEKELELYKELRDIANRDIRECNDR